MRTHERDEVNYTGAMQSSKPVLVFAALTLVFTALHYSFVTEMNRPWPTAIALPTKYLPAPLEANPGCSWMTDSHYFSKTLGIRTEGSLAYPSVMGFPLCCWYTLVQRRRALVFWLSAKATAVTCLIGAICRVWNIRTYDKESYNSEFFLKRFHLKGWIKGCAW